MAKITKEEVLKIARMSKMTLHESEIEKIITELDAVLSYAERVSEIASDVEINVEKNINKFRDDQVVPTDYQPIMSQAPSSEDNYFIVPKILDND